MFVFGICNNYDRLTGPDKSTFSLIVKGPHEAPRKPEQENLVEQDCLSPALKVFKLGPVPSATSSSHTKQVPQHFVFPATPLTPGPPVDINDLDNAMSLLFSQHSVNGKIGEVHYDRYCSG